MRESLQAYTETDLLKEALPTNQHSPLMSMLLFLIVREDIPSGAGRLWPLAVAATPPAGNVSSSRAVALRCPLCAAFNA